MFWYKILIIIIKLGCSDPTPWFGHSNVSSFLYNTSVEITCEDGYIIHGDSLITCQMDQSWTDYPGCYPEGKTELTDQHYLFFFLFHWDSVCVRARARVCVSAWVVLELIVFICRCLVWKLTWKITDRFDVPLASLVLTTTNFVLL